MKDTAISVISDITQEVISYNQIPGAVVVNSIFSEYRRRREEAARTILMKRIGEAQLDPLQAAYKDDFIGIIYTYMQCASKGAARINLDLLAQAIAGSAKLDQLYPDKFHKHINVLSSLTRDEIFVIGTYLRCRTTVYKEAERRQELLLGAAEENIWIEMMSNLVPSSFKSEDHVKVVLGSLLRTGLITVMAPGIGIVRSYAFTVLLDEISELIDFTRSYTEYFEY